MPPRLHSRHTYTNGFEDEDGILMLTEREPFSYQQFPDNGEHTVGEGDTLHLIAARYFAAIPGAANLFWVIADFQPDPIHDPTIRLVPGATLVVPSVRTVLETIFSEQRRLETGL